MSRSSRRAFLGTLGAAAAVFPDLGSTAIRMGADLSAAAPAAGQAAASYDLLIKGGRVIDPAAVEEALGLSRRAPAAAAAR